MNQNLNVSSLSEQVYQYLRNQINNGSILPGSFINIGKIAERLGISKTPLRDALIHLEFENFVTIMPRRGVIVNKLTLQEIKNAYQAVGSLEASVIRECYDKIEKAHIRELEEINNKMIANIRNADFDDYFEMNLAFHEIFLRISDNELLKKFITPIKQRLYDFPRKSYLSEWELRNCKEHKEFIQCLKTRDPDGAARILNDVHWSFKYQEKYIRQFHEGG